ncbi:MAG: hypothetical protein QHJ81_01090 [Anaerolineae bacterium]|nr:hypothetical protein [Anaerolineae bacterium]
MYDVPAGGEPLWTETQEGVMVQGGAFTALLGSVNGIPPEVLAGKELWLAVAVRGPGEGEFTLLAPRQGVSAASSPTGAAGGMTCPHDHFGETWTGSGSSGLNITNTGAGNGITLHNNSQFATLLAYNASSGTGVYGSSSTSGKGVWGFSTTGFGVYGESPRGTGVYGTTAITTGTTSGVVGVVSSPDGYGVYGMNTTNGTGVYGYSNGGAGVNARGANAVVGISSSPGYAAIYGRNDATTGTGSGIWGEAKSPDGYGGYFKNTAGDGVRVESVGGNGVYVHSATDNGVEVRSAGDHGVKVESAYYDGVFVNSAGIHGLYVNSAGGNGVLVGSAVDSGVYVQSAHKGLYVESSELYGVHAFGKWMGVWGEVEGTRHDWGLHTTDYIYALSYFLLGSVMHVMQNGGSEPLEPGDVVVFSGLGAPLEEGVPTVQVAKAASANSTGVAGVVFSRYNPLIVPENAKPGEDSMPSGWEFMPAGPVPPGEYLTVVIQGPAQVKASAVAGPIRSGDLLSSAPEAGYAAKAAEVSLGGVKMALPGTVFGKALEALDAGQDTGLVWVCVTLQ